MTRLPTPTKKKLILEVARGLGSERFTLSEVEEIRRQLIVRLGERGKTSADYVADVLESAGMSVVWSVRADTRGRFEAEFRDLLRFGTLQEAENCLARLDALLRKFRAEGETAAAERVLELARRGRRRAEMIARNPRVVARKRAEKQEIAQWFAIWLENPGTFFDWLELRKKSVEFRESFGTTDPPSKMADR